MALTVLGKSGSVVAAESLPAGEPAKIVFSESGLAKGNAGEKPFGQPLVGALGRSVALGPGEESQVVFLVTWCFPNLPKEKDGGEIVGNYYSTRFADAAAVAEYVAEHFDRLAGRTRLWHDTWYDSTLPHWLLDRLFSTVSTLATSTCQWWANGRFWAWEGVGCCRGTCIHVWNYAHAMARLFPAWSGPSADAGLQSDAGFDARNRDGPHPRRLQEHWAGDSQGGTVLKAYREHHISTDDTFLKANWPRIRKTLEFLLARTGNNDGLLEGSQHNTYDVNFFGPNTMVGSLYLAALRAGEEMARDAGRGRVGRAAAERSSRAADGSPSNGSSTASISSKRSISKSTPASSTPTAASPISCSARGGRPGGAGLPLSPGDGRARRSRRFGSTTGRRTWARRTQPIRRERWFARPGEAGLFTCTWPKSQVSWPRACVTARRSGPASSTRWPGTWPGRGW